MDMIIKFIWTYGGAAVERANYLATSMDFTQWIWVLVVCVVLGFLLLRGHADKIGS